MSAAVGLDLTQRSRLRSLDVAGSDSVTLNVVLTVLGTDISGEHLQAALCRSIRGHGLTSQLGHHGADVYDLAVTLLDHGRNNRLGYDEGSVQINVDYLSELLGGHIDHGNSLDNARIVYKDIDYAYILLYLRNHGVYSFLVGYIADIAVSLDAFLRISRDPLVNQLLFNIVKNDGCACLCIRRSDCEADAVGSAGHQSHLSLKRKIVYIISHFIVSFSKFYVLAEITFPPLHPVLNLRFPCQAPAPYPLRQAPCTKPSVKFFTSGPSLPRRPYRRSPDFHLPCPR